MGQRRGVAGDGSSGGFGMSLTNGGSPIVIAFVAFVIGFGVLLAQGVTPKLTPSETNDSSEYEVVIEPTIAGEGGLQLKTLKFRECAANAAVGLLVDRSGSMRGKKLTDLKAALTTFTSNLGNKSVIGISSFSSNDDGATAVREDVPFGLYETLKPQVTSAISRLNALGATNTRTGLTFVKDRIIPATAAFPEKKFALIVLSDGIPETFPADCASGRSFGQRCFANSQDPTLDPNVAQEIKNAGIKIYSIAIYYPNNTEDTFFLPDMRGMMQRIATDNTSYYEAPDTSQLQEIYRSIAQRICSDIQ